MTLRIPDLTLPKLDVTPKMLNFTAAVIDGILENKRVVAKDPQLKAYLGFAKVLFDRAKASPEEALAPLFGPNHQCRGGHLWRILQAALAPLEM